jgi:MoxR-like ATPase
MPVNHLAEVLKILDGALKSNHSMAANYAGLLADKLEQEGSRREALMIRERLARAPAAIAKLQGAGNLPVDGESRLHTLDVSRPTDTERLALPPTVSRRLEDFTLGIANHDALAAAGAALPNRLLLHGPPGTGKTATAKWLAAKLKLPLLTVRCDTLVSSLLGQTSRNLRRAFEFAQEQPCVLFLDEFDALASARGNERDVGELQRVVIALLQNIDALPDSTILIAATNHEGLLDPAVWRRFSFQVAMPMPDLPLRSALWERFLGRYLPPHLSPHELADLSDGLTGAAIEQVCLDAKRSAVLAAKTFVPISELLRRLGMMIALTRKVKLTTIEDEIRWLRAWNPKHFTVRELAGIYGVSTRQILNTTKEEKSGDEKGRRAAQKR